MAAVTAQFSTDVVTLTTTVADTVTLTNKGSHKTIFYNVSGAAPLYVNLGQATWTGAVKSQGTLTLDTQPVDDGASEGTLTIAEPVTDTDDFTIGTTVYTLLDTVAAANDVFIGANEAATKVNIVHAINGTGTPGTHYGLGTVPHPDVTIAAFSVDDAVITARVAGTAGDAIATTETFTHISNVFDAATLGTTTAGTDADTMTVGDNTYIFRDTLDPLELNAVKIGASLAATKTTLEKLFDLSGTAGTDYSDSTVANPLVTIAAFAGDDAVITAVLAGVAGDLIGTTESFTAGTNVFDDPNLGVTTAGAEGLPAAATAAVDHLTIPTGEKLEILSKKYGISQKGLVCSIVGSANDYLIQLVD